MNINSASIQTHQPEGHTENRLTVLIVDDSKVIRLALNKILRNDFVVIQANDGEDAWNKLMENDLVSAVFSDVSMPNLDGFGLLERVRSSKDTNIASLPFIIITANDDDPDFVSKVRNAGGNDLITKPFKTNEITNCINEHVIIHQAVTAEIPSFETDNLADTEVANILGLEMNEQSAIDEQVIEKPDVKTDHNETEFTIDEDFFNDAVATTSNNIETNNNETEFTIDEDFFNDAVATASNNIETSNSEIELTIDEDFFNNSIASVNAPETVSNTDIIANEVISYTTAENNTNQAEYNETPYSSELNPRDIAIPELETSTPDINNELSFELELEANIETEASPIENDKPVNQVDPQNIKLGLEQARKRAMDIAREQVESLQHNDVVEDSRRATERSQILAELQIIREKEIDEGSYAQDDDCSTIGKIASFFSKFVRIISKSVKFRKK